MTHKGFTLIELMIVVAIIGILAAVGIPQYQNYVARAQVAEGLSMASSIKTAISEYFSINGKYPEGDLAAIHTALGINTAFSFKGNYVRGIKVTEEGKFEILFKPAPDAHTLIAEKSFYMIPKNEGGSISWRCACASSDTALCLNVNGGTPDPDPNKRQIDEKYLPSSCLEESAGDTDSPDDPDDPVDPAVKKVDPVDPDDPDDTGPVAWTSADGNACWDTSFGGWVAGNTANTMHSNQDQMNQYAGWKVLGPPDDRWLCE